MRLARLALLCMLVLAAASFRPGQVRADSPASEPQRQAFESARSAARAALVQGPADVALLDQATLKLPAHFGFVPRAQAAALMSAMGNRTGEGLVGLIFPLSGQSGWFVVVTYDASGYIKDDDARHWDADKLLKSLKDGTEAANSEREKAGIPPITVTRWIESPSYAAQTHSLIWSAEAKRKEGADPDPTINYNTLLLGRQGYISLNLVTLASQVSTDKATAGELLADVSFNQGKRYADFNSSTDKVAAYGLAALIAGVAAKKLGLLALLAATIVKFAKVIALAAAGLVAAGTRWLKARNARAG